MTIFMVLAQMADLAFWSLAPHLESNPIMAAADPWMVVGAKTAGVVAVGAGAAVLARRGHSSLGKAVLVVGAWIGILGAISAIHVLWSEMDAILFFAASMVVLAAIILILNKDPDRSDARRRNQRK